MAKLKNRLPGNAEGDFYVDKSCINCGVSRWIAPAVFDALDKKSRVFKQPETEEETRRALMALVSCPTRSIGTESERDLSIAYNSYPELIDGNVYHCGFHSSKSFGATSYFVKREAGNLLVDSPRFEKPLVEKLEKMGGVQMMFLTHKDDVADHKKFHEHFGCERILHADDVTIKTGSVEREITGVEPIKLADDLLIIPAPGHTKGSACLLYGKYLFTGDHLAENPGRGFPTAFINFCWYSWAEQIKSMKRLAEYSFEWILPGHSGRAYYPAGKMAEKMRDCIRWMESA